MDKIMFGLRRLFTNLFGNKSNLKESERVRTLRRFSENDPELSGLLDPIIELIWINDNASIEFEKKFKENENSINGLSLENKKHRDLVTTLEKKNKDMEAELTSLRNDRKILDGIVLDLEISSKGGLKHSLAIEKLMKKEPELAMLLENKEESKIRIRPTLFSNENVEKDKFAIRDNKKKTTGIIDDFEVITFTAPKSENCHARLSEDRVGFSIEDSKIRLVAVDGVASSTHSRHLANRICKESLLGKNKLNSILRDFQDELDRLSIDRSNDQNTSNLEIFNKEQRSRGSACVICIAEYDFSSKTATISHVGDSVAFVEVQEPNCPKDSTRWKIFPEMTSQDFDRTPDQLNSAFPDRHTSPDLLSVKNATGRIILCTDGMAEYIIRNDPDLVMRSVINDEPTVCLQKLRNGNIEDDDLSLIALHSNTLLSKNTSMGGH